MDSSVLIQPVKLGDLTLKNKICMSALTRMRSDKGVPNQLMADYYAQRANAGLIFSECTGIRSDSNAFPGNPFIFSEEHVAGWQKVTKAVHENNGLIFIQIWHCGRATHSELQDGQHPISSYPIAISYNNGMVQKPHEIPRQLSIDEIKEMVQLYKKGAENAKRAGFDGIELHGGSGYLVDQFLRDHCNKRNDQYGGSIENRCRFALEIIDALIEVFGKDRVGIKVTPLTDYNDMDDSNPFELYKYLFQQLSLKGIAFVDLRGYSQDNHKKDLKDKIPELYKSLRPFFNGILIANEAQTPESGISGIKNGEFDMVSFGKLYICNRDLALRLQKGQELDRQFNGQFYYSGDAQGYTDYPLFEDWKKQ